MFKKDDTKKAASASVSYDEARKIKKTVTFTGDQLMVMHNIIIRFLADPSNVTELIVKTDAESVLDFFKLDNRLTTELLAGMGIDIPEGAMMSLSDLYGERGMNDFHKALKSELGL